MKKIVLVLCTLAMVIYAGSAYAMDFGFYLDYGQGEGEMEVDRPYSESFDIDTDFWGIGFQFETSPLVPNKVYSYRFQSGFEGRALDDGDASLDLGGVMINNTFAFGGMVSKNTRLWAGPQVMVGYYYGETEKEIWGGSLDYYGAGLGLGLAGGANFGVGKSIITTTLGARSVGMAGVLDGELWQENIEGFTNEFFISVGMLF